MLRPADNKHGFTLVELLAVIAIIGILAGLTFAGIGRILESAKIASTENTLKQVSTALVNYYTKHNSYPPAYGYLSRFAFDEKLRGLDPETIDPTDALNSGYFETEHYMQKIGLFNALDHYDNFALDNSDTDYDNQTGLLEYYPSTGEDSELNFFDTSLISGQRPLIYVPVNLRQFRKAKKIWDANPAGGFPDFLNADILELDFPPANYDAFVVINAGPVINTQGLVYSIGGDLDRLNPPNTYPEAYYYHLAGLATYYMMTRDIDNDGQYDFDYDARNSGGEGDIIFPYSQRTDRDGNSFAKRGLGILGPIYKVIE